MTHGGSGAHAVELRCDLNVEHGACCQGRDDHDQKASRPCFLELIKQINGVDAAFGCGCDSLSADQQAAAKSVQPARGLH